MKASVLTVLTALLLLATPAAGVAAPPAMPEQVPELMHRSILPVTTDVPTCATVADRPRGETDFLVVGLANGTVDVFHPSGSDMIVRVIELNRGRPVDDVCAIRLAAAYSDFALLALQGNKLSVMGSEVSRVETTVALPVPTGSYTLVRVPAADGPEAGHAERALLCDDRNVFEIRIGAAGQRWSVTRDPVLSDPRGVSVRALSDRIVLAPSSSGVREFTVDVGLVALPDEQADGSLGQTGGSAGEIPTEPAIIPGAVSKDGSALDVLLRSGDGLWSPAVVSLEDSLTVAMTVRDSLLLLGGTVTQNGPRGTGWLTLVNARGEIVATGEHGRAVAAATAVGEWVAVQGDRQNLSLYDLELTPIWDNASQVKPLALLAAHLNPDESEDLVVIGMRMFVVAMQRVQAIREVLNRPNFMDGAVERGDGMYLDRPMLNVYYSSAGDLADTVEDRRQQVDQFRLSRDYVEAARQALTARAAAAALGHWDDAEALRRQGAQLLAMPRREQAALFAAALLLVVGLWNAVTVIRHPSRQRSARTWWDAEAWPPVMLAIAGLIVWRLLGAVFWSPALLAGASIAGVGASIAWLRGEGVPVLRVAGAPVEELELRIGEFTHGGDGSSEQGRKKLTTLAYIIQEMLDSTDDPDRYAVLRERLELRYGSFYPAKYQLAMELLSRARAAGVAVDEAATLAGATASFHEAVSALLNGPSAADRQRDQELHSPGEDALEAWQTIREAADAAAAIVRRNAGSSVTACVSRLLDERQEVLDAMGVEVVCDLGIDASEDAVAIQRAQLHFVLENLVTDALRAMDDSRDKRLSFIGTARPNVYELRVSDTGCGISEQSLREIFIPKESVLGGLGLPHSREILRRVGGNIDVESTDARVGTTMLVTLRYWTQEPPNGGER